MCDAPRDSDRDGGEVRRLLALTLAGCSAPAALPSEPRTGQIQIFDTVDPCTSFEVRTVVDGPDGLDDAWAESNADAWSTWSRLLPLSGMPTRTINKTSHWPCLIQFSGVDALGISDYGRVVASTDRYVASNGSDVLGAEIKIVRDDSMDSASRYSTALHELGHVLMGPEHVRDREILSIMWPLLTVPGHVSCFDWKRACAAWQCQTDCEGNGWVR